MGGKVEMIEDQSDTITSFEITYGPDSMTATYNLRWGGCSMRGNKITPLRNGEMLVRLMLLD